MVHSRFLLQLRALIEVLRGHSEMPPESAPPPSGILREEIEKARQMLAAAKNNPSERPAALRCPALTFSTKFKCLGLR